MNTIRSAGVVALVALLAAACSGGEDDAAPVNTVPQAEPADEAETATTSTTSPTSTTTTSTTTTSTTTSVAPLTDEEQILDVIERYWWTIGNAFDPPEPDADVWAAVATFENSVERLQRQQERLDASEGIRNVAPDGPYVLSGAVTELDASTAIAFVCVVDDAVLYDLATDEELTAVSIINLNRTELEFVGGRWLVDLSTQNDVFERSEEEECAAALPRPS